MILLYDDVFPSIAFVIYVYLKKHVSIQNRFFDGLNMNKAKTPRASQRTAPQRLPMFTAAIRYRDGGNELLRITNALDIDDARKVAMGALMNVQVLLIAVLD